MISPRRAALALDTRQIREASRAWSSAGYGKGLNIHTARYVTPVRVIIAACWFVIGLAAIATF